MFSELTCAGEFSGASKMRGVELPSAADHAPVEVERLSALAQMASGLTHGLNNSLTPIIGFADFLLASDFALSQESVKCVRGIRAAADDIAALVERVRGFYRNRHPEEPLEPLDLNALVKESIVLLQPRWQQLAQREGIHIRIESKLGNGLPRIREMEAELRDAATQLILNALESMPKGGSVVVSTQEIQPASPIGSDSTGRRISLEVRDSGIGMNGMTQQRCFEPFFSTKGPRRAGLGLSVVYGLMRRHGGKIELESEPNRGTTVRLLFKAD